MNAIDTNANAQLGLVNANTESLINIAPVLNVNRDDESQATAIKEGFLAKLERQVRPVAHAKKEAEARIIKAKSEADVVKELRAIYPTFSDEQLMLAARGYMFSPMEANNFFATVKAADLISKGVEGLPGLPQSCIDQDVRGASTAYEEDVQDIWAKLIKEEFSSGNPYSKRLKQILQGMDSNEAKQFQFLCSFSLWTPVGPENKPTPIPVISKDEKSWFYNDGAIPVQSLASLESLGLISMTKWTTFRLAPGNSMAFLTSSKAVFAKNETEKELSFDFGQAMFLDVGIELAEICDAKQNDAVFNLVAKTSGLTIDVVDR